jgi:hypothetical protein
MSKNSDSMSKAEKNLLKLLTVRIWNINHNDFDISERTGVPPDVVKRIKVVVMMKAGNVNFLDIVAITEVPEDEVRRINAMVLLFKPNTCHSDSDIASITGVPEDEVKCIKIAACLKMNQIRESDVEYIAPGMKVSIDEVKRIEKELHKCGTLLYLL